MINETQFERNPDFIYRRIVDESVLVPIHRDVANMDSIYTLNGVGATIWERLAEPASLKELQQAVLDEYDAAPELVNADVTQFLDEMVSINAIREV